MSFVLHELSEVHDVSCVYADPVWLILSDDAHAVTAKPGIRAPPIIDEMNEVCKMQDNKAGTAETPNVMVLLVVLRCEWRRSRNLDVEVCRSLMLIDTSR